MDGLSLPPLSGPSLSAARPSPQQPVERSQAAPSPGDGATLSTPEAETPQTPLLTGLRRNFGRGADTLERTQQVGEALQDEGGPGRGLARLGGEMVGGAAGRVAGAAVCSPVPPVIPVCAFVGGVVGADVGGRAAEAIYDRLPGAAPLGPLENLNPGSSYHTGA